jgi:hypothetical protein
MDTTPEEKAIQEIHTVAEVVAMVARQLQTAADTKVPSNTDPLLVPEHQRIRREWKRVAEILTTASAELKGQTVGQYILAMACGLTIRTDPVVETQKPERKLTLIQGGKKS